MKILIILLTLYLLAFGQTPYILAEYKSAYNLVEIKTNKVPLSYKKKLTSIIKEYTDELKIDTSGYSERVIAMIVSRVAIGETLVLKVELIVGEEVKRLDDNKEVFAITYQKVDIFEVEDLEEDLVDSAEYLLEDFKNQYIEDNEAVFGPVYKNFAKKYKYETSYKEALKRSKLEKKDILMIQVTNYCPWCRKLEKRVLADKELNAQVHKDYIPLIVNREEKTLDKRFDTPIVPVTYIISYKDDTKFISKPGYRSKEDFLHIIKKK